MQKNFTIGAEKTFLGNISIRYAFYSNFATFDDFEKKIAKRTHLVFQKNPNYVRFEKPYYFSRIHICYNLVIKKFKLRAGHQRQVGRYQLAKT